MIFIFNMFLKYKSLIPLTKKTLFNKFKSKAEKILAQGDKNYTKMKQFDLLVQEKQQSYLKNEDRLVLTDSMKENPQKVKAFAPDPKKFNKILKKGYNQSMSTAGASQADALKDDFSRSQLQSTKENRKFFEEQKVFDKLYFVKKETQRLLEKEKNTPDYYYHQITDPETQQMSQKMLHYTKNINDVKNGRIQSMVSHTKENKNLHYLMEAGLLNETQSIDKVIQTAMNIKLSSHQENTNHESTEIVPMTQDKLTEFQQAFISSPESQLNTMITLQKIKDIRGYENFIFDKCRTQDITLRKKGTLQFKDLSVQENVNYLKYTISSVEDTLKMFQSCQDDIGLQVNFVEKIAISRLPEKQSILHVINDFRYRALLRKFTQNLEQLDNLAFSNLVFSIGKIHQDEQGIIYEKLFTILMQKFKAQILNREFNSSDLAFLSEGVIKLVALQEDEKIQSHVLDQMKKIKFTENSIMELNKCLAFASHFKQSELMLNMLPCYLDKKEDLLKPDIMNLVYSLPVLSKHGHSLVLKEFFRNINDKLQETVGQMNLTEMSDMSVLMANIDYSDKKIIYKMNSQIQIQVRKLEPTSDIAISNLIHNLSIFDLKSLQDNDQLNEFFPQQVLDQSSPRFIPYSTLSKQLMINIDNFKVNSLLIALKGLTQIAYQNEQIFESIFQKMLEQKNLSENQRIQTLYYVYKSGYAFEQYKAYFSEMLEEIHSYERISIHSLVLYFTLQSQYIRDFDSAYLFYDKMENHIKNMSTIMGISQKLSLIWNLQHLQIESQLIHDMIKTIDISSLVTTQQKLIYHQINNSNDKEYNLELNDLKLRKQFKIWFGTNWRAYDLIEKVLKDNNVSVQKEYWINHTYVPIYLPQYKKCLFLQEDVENQGSIYPYFQQYFKSLEDQNIAFKTLTLDSIYLKQVTGIDELQLKRSITILSCLKQ